jgi:membrane-associated protein
MQETFGQVRDILVQIVSNLTNPDAWKAILERPDVTVAAFIAITLIVFVETGLLVGFFLPGDSLLVTAGVVGHGAGWPIHVLIPILWAAAIIGDSTGYLIGAKLGPKLFQKENSFFFRKKYLLMAQDFYAKHGGKTIVYAKFVPIIRTFAPVVAGAGAMPYRRFLAFSVGGVIGWVTSMILLGYTLHLWLEPILEKVFGRKVEVAKNIDKVILVVIFVSILPILIKGFKSWRSGRTSVPADAPEAVNAA